MSFRDSSLKTITNFLIKVFGSSQPSEIVKVQNNVESVNFSARAWSKAQKLDLNTLPSGLRKLTLLIGKMQKKYFFFAKGERFAQLNIGSDDVGIYLPNISNDQISLEGEGDF
jgi:hypothetical protein